MIDPFGVRWKLFIVIERAGSIGKFPSKFVIDSVLVQIEDVSQSVNQSIEY